MSGLTVGSLFSGVGGLDLGLERAGHRVLWQVEKDDFCRRVLAKHWPDVTRFEDARDVGAHNLEPVDLIAGGFPCQPISHNGHGLVQDDERWLWPEFARIVRELRPGYVLVENVPAIAGRGLGDVLGDLAALRYDAEWTCIRAADAGAPHRRERLFVVAYPERVGRQTGARVFGSVSPQDLRQPASWSGVPHRNADGRLRLTPPADVFGMADGPATELDLARLRAAGNAVVPQVAEYLGRHLLTALSASTSPSGKQGVSLPLESSL